MENGYNENPEMNEEEKKEKSGSGEDNYAYKNVIRNKSNSRTWSVASFVLSVISVIWCCSPWIALMFGVLGVAFAAYSRKNLGYFDGLSLAGLIVGIFGIVFAVMSVIGNYVLADSGFSNFFDQYEEYLEEILEKSEDTGSMI